VDTSAPDGRFVGLILRDLKAAHVRFLPAHTPPPQADNALVARLPDGRLVVATFAAMPAERDALARRLEMLASSFAVASVFEGEQRAKTERLPRSLHEELRALAARAHAQDAVVVDSQSPIVWGSASTLARQGARREPGDSAVPGFSSPVLTKERPSHDWEEDSAALADGAQDAGIDPDIVALSARAIEWFHQKSQSMPPSAQPHALQSSSHRGRNAAFLGVTSHMTDDGGYVASGFSGIYALILVYHAPFDEMRAHRALGESLARIERLVMALPPFDPDPTTGAGAGVGVVRPLRGLKRR
jgi:hypothetical protein